MSKMKTTVAAPQVTAEEAERAVHNAQAAVAKLQEERAALPGVRSAALKAFDVPAALAAAQRLAELPLHLAVAECQVTEARIAALDIQIELQRGYTAAKESVAAEHRAKYDEARAAGVGGLDLRLLAVAAEETEKDAMVSRQRLGGLNSNRGRLTAQLDQRLAALGAM